MLRRLGFAVLAMAAPLLAVGSRRALVIVVPLGIAMLVLASVIETEGQQPLRRTLEALGRPAGLAAVFLVFWSGLSSSVDAVPQRRVGTPAQHGRLWFHGAGRRVRPARTDARLEPLSAAAWRGACGNPRPFAYDPAHVRRREPGHRPILARPCAASAGPDDACRSHMAHLQGSARFRVPPDRGCHGLPAAGRCAGGPACLDPGSRHFCCRDHKSANRRACRHAGHARIGPCGSSPALPYATQCQTHAWCEPSEGRGDQNLGKDRDGRSGQAHHGARARYCDAGQAR